MADEIPTETADTASEPAPAPEPKPAVAKPAPASVAPAPEPVDEVVAETTLAPQETPQERAARIGWVRRELKNISGHVMKWPTLRLRHKHGDVHEIVLPADQAVPQVMDSLSCTPCNEDGSALASGVAPTEHQAAAVAAQAAKE
jgi:hypothetical protein